MRQAYCKNIMMSIWQLDHFSDPELYKTLVRLHSLVLVRSFSFSNLSKFFLVIDLVILSVVLVLVIVIVKYMKTVIVLLENIETF